MSQRRDSASLDDRIAAALLANPTQTKPKALAKKLGIRADDYPEFRLALKRLVAKGKIEKASGRSLRPASVHGECVGIFRAVRSGDGFVRPRPGQGQPIGDIFIRAGHVGDAATGDLVLVQLVPGRRGQVRPGRAVEGRIVQVVERASDRFVGLYQIHGDEAFVKVDGGVFREPIYVGDPGVKGAAPGDKVVLEMLRFPSPIYAGEGVVVEVLGPHGKPGVDLLSIVRQFNLPDEFSEAALGEARDQARVHENEVLGSDRRDLTETVVVTIDPTDARDFDDAIGLERDEKGFWQLAIHIADVSTFVRPGSPLDHEAKARGTSVYLPGRVLPMLPELISNGLASLQQGKLRLVKTVLIEFDPAGRMTHIEFANAGIRVRRRLTYETVMRYFTEPEAPEVKLPAEVRALLDRMRELARILRARRRAKGMLELSMPEITLEYDAHHHISGAHYADHDESHQLIEEFMVTANEAVASHLAAAEVSFLRRIHESPDPLKLKAFADFLRTLGIQIEDYQSRFELQRVLAETVDLPIRPSVHYALLRSLKEAVYSPEAEGHFALASDCYCHFTSPIRRYPDLTVHRMVDQLIREGKAGSDHSELVLLGEHCSFTERRAAKAERELVKVKLLHYLADKVGEEWDMLITGVEEFGFFAQGIEFPAEGLVHVRTLIDDFYQYDRAGHSLVGRRTGKRFRLGEQVRCVLWKVDEESRQLDLRLADEPPRAPKRPKGRKKGRTRPGR